MWTTKPMPVFLVYHSERSWSPESFSAVTEIRLFIEFYLFAVSHALKVSSAVGINHNWAASRFLISPTIVQQIFIDSVAGQLPALHSMPNLDMNHLTKQPSFSSQQSPVESLGHLISIISSSDLTTRRIISWPSLCQIMSRVGLFCAIWINL